MKKSNIETEKLFFEPEYLSRIQSANFLAISIQKFDTLKDIDYIKFGKRKIFSIKALRDYAERHTVRGDINGK